MREERLAAEGWGDFLTPGFVRAWEEKKLLSLSELNSGFERPRFPEQLSLSYFQAGWLCDFLAENYGFDKIRQMLVSFGEGKSMEEVFEQVVGASVEEVDKLFQEEVSETLRPLSAALKEPEKIEIEDPELALSTWVQAAQKSPDNYLLNLSAGRKLIDAGRGNEAVPLLKRAVELFPYAAGEDSPYALLSGVYEAEGRIDEWIDILKQRRKMSPQSSDSGLKLAQLMMQREDREAAVGILEDLMFVNPLNPELHQTLGDAYLQTGSAEKALREFLVLLELGPTDVAGTQYRIASALALDGQNDLARRHVLLALEIAPSFEEAQRLLLRLVRR